MEVIDHTAGVCQVFLRGWLALFEEGAKTTVKVDDIKAVTGR